MLEVLNPLSLSYQWCHLNMKFHFPPILISQVESSYTLLYFTMNKEKKSIGQINTQNVRFMTPFVNFFFFPLKEKRIVRKKTASVTIWGFILQSLLTPPESGYRWWNISYYFPKNTVELRKTCSSSSTTNTCNRENANYLKGFLITQLPSRFSRVRLCATSWTADYQASLSMGFFRQEHWSGLPFPSPMHESGKWKWSHSVMSDS